ncbi:hypothetical protein BGZ54_007159 [Gamsiella multidivaricata]|nr:hypothetical protein BGZ54_007159 [Gamsiella multidivaricata]
MSSWILASKDRLLYVEQITRFGFDEFMNLVLDNAVEVNIKKSTRKEVGRILLKGDNITLIQSVSAPAS